MKRPDNDTDSLLTPGTEKQRKRLMTEAQELVRTFQKCTTKLETAMCVLNEVIHEKGEGFSPPFAF